MVLLGVYLYHTHTHAHSNQLLKTENTKGAFNHSGFHFQCVETLVVVVHIVLLCHSLKKKIRSDVKLISLNLNITV